MVRAKRLISSLVAVALFALTQEQATFRADVAEVRVDAQVVDGKKIITGLTASDFEVFDEDQRQTLTRFGRESDPVSLVILLDISGSMKRHVRQMATTAQSALKHLTPEDRVSLMVFAKDVETITDFTDKFSDLDRDIDVGAEQALPTGTAIYNAVIEAARSLERHAKTRPNTRRAILILTDNESLNYQIDDQQVLRALFSADAVLDAIVTSKTDRPKPRPIGEYRNPDFTPTDIFKIAEETGGEAYRVDRADRAFPMMMERLRNRYGLVYKAPAAPPGQFRRIRVELSPDAKRKYSKATVRARSGYYTAS
jgi:VWFA-related protein